MQDKLTDGGTIKSTDSQTTKRAGKSLRKTEKQLDVSHLGCGRFWWPCRHCDERRFPTRQSRNGHEAVCDGRTEQDDRDTGEQADLSNFTEGSR